MTSFLQRFVNIRREEILPLLLAACYFFSILTALMVLRPAREALGIQRGIESVRWLFMGTLIITLAANPVFGLLVSRVRRMTAMASIHTFFAANLLIFYTLLVFAPQTIGEITGLVFYVWMSVCNLFITMVFWALMVDRFSLDQSKRLFGAIAAGGTLGAIFGSWLAVVLAHRIGTPGLLLIAAGALLLAVGLAWTLLHRHSDQNAAETTTSHSSDPVATTATNKANGRPVEERVLGGSAWEGFRAALRSPFLLGISVYVLILAILTTFLYFTCLQMVAALGEDLDMRTGVFARIDLITQSATLVLQILLTGHIIKRLGVSVALALVPIIVVIGYIGLALVGTLAALVIFEATFRSTQRAIMRPARETLFTVVSREDKYKSKAFIDTFVYRGGDAVGAQTEGLLGRLGMGLVALTSVAVPLALLWAVLGIWLGRRQSKLAIEGPSAH